MEKWNDKNISAYNIFVFLQFCLYFTVQLFWKCTHTQNVLITIIFSFR